MELSAWGECDVTWDDVFFAAELPQPYDPDAVLTKKPTADEHTVAFVDFDSPGTYRLEGGAKLTDDGGGRFGKGLRLERALASSAVIPLALERMPDEGTLEFWFAPDDVPEHIYWFAVLLAGDLDMLKLQADTSDSLRLSWRSSAGIYDPQPSIALRCLAIARLVPRRPVAACRRAVGPAGGAVLLERRAGRLQHRAAAAVLPDAVVDQAGVPALGVRLVRADR